MQERIGLIVYFRNLKVLKRIKRLGNVSYFHKKRKYAILYVNASEQASVIKSLESLRHVRRVDVSKLDDSAYQLHIEDISKLTESPES